VRFVLPLIALCLFGVSTAFAAQPTEERDIAQLRVLDKVTARVEALEVPVDQTLKFGTLLITVRACRVTPPEETPEAAAFVEVSEMKPNEPESQRFKGWMFASSPALSALEHPIYDLWVTGCKASKPAPQPQPTSPQPAPATQPKKP
jgi:hypothetical protein